MTIPRLLKVKFYSLCHDPISIVVIGVDPKDLLGYLIVKNQFLGRVESVFLDFDKFDILILLALGFRCLNYALTQTCATGSPLVIEWPERIA